MLVQLEELGFCARGEAKDFATSRHLSIGGSLPINTSGGLLGEAYIHGMNGITEGVRQVRGTSYNQVEVSNTCSSHLARACQPAHSSSRRPMTVTPRPPQPTRAKLIIESAFACFRTQGLNKTTIVDIARAADISRSTVYEYFRDKAAIIEASAEHSSQRFYREMAKAMGPGDSVEEKLTLAAVFVTRARPNRRARNVFRRRRSEPAAYEERRSAAA